MKSIFCFTLFVGAVAGCVDVNGQLVPSFLHPSPSPRPQAQTATASGSVEVDPTALADCKKAAVEARAGSLMRAGAPGIEAARAAAEEDLAKDPTSVYAGVRDRNCRVLLLPTPPEASEVASSLVKRVAQAKEKVLRAKSLVGPEFATALLVQRELSVDLAAAHVVSSANGLTVGGRAPSEWRELRDNLTAYVVGAEADAEKAMAVAKAFDDKRKAKAEAETAHAEAVAKERKAVEAAEKLCASGMEACKKACSGDDQFACVRQGILLYGASKTTESAAKAEALFKKACGDGLVYGCDTAENLDDDVVARQQKARQLWNSVSASVDSVTNLRHTNAVARSLPYHPMRARAIVAVDGEIGRMVKDEFCPAKKNFIEFTGPVEFQTRAKDKCDNDAPAAALDSGIGEVPRLKADCRAVVASACGGASK